MSKAILYDATRCVGCKECERGCAESNKLPYDDAIAAQPKQSEHKYTVVLQKDDKFMRRLCMNCEDPACASVCPVAALRKTEAGPVIYEASRCMGCRYCMLACPFGVPKYEWTQVLPRVRKCTMCDQRVAEGKLTACAEACKNTLGDQAATIFGDRDELLAEAKKRISENPGTYVPTIYGEKEVGGTSVFLLSSVPFEQFGYRTDLVTDKLPERTFKVLSRIPDFLPIGGAVLGGVWWITHRREDVAAVEGKKDDGGAK